MVWQISLVQHVLSSSGGSKRSNTKPSNAHSINRGDHLKDERIAYYITLSELEEATQNFSKKIGKGSFGSVYYGKMKDGKEVAVKIMADLSSQGQFVTEVLLYDMHGNQHDVNNYIPTSYISSYLYFIRHDQRSKSSTLMNNSRLQWARINVLYLTYKKT